MTMPRPRPAPEGTSPVPSSDAATPRTITVIVPAFNEAEKIAETVRALRAEGTRLAGDGTFLIYVVNDGSTDDTAAVAREAGADRVLHHRVNQGLGAAMRTGLAAARADGADIAIKFDADLQHSPADLEALIRPIVEDSADVVYGNRFERIEYRMPPVRRIGNLVFTGLMRWLTRWPIRDGQPGIFAVSRSYLEVFHIPGDYNYTQQILLDAYHKGMRFAHVPVTFRKRTTGRSFVSYKYPFLVLSQIAMVILGLKPMRIFGTLGLIFLTCGVVLFAVELAGWLFGDAEKPVRHVNAVLGLSLFGLQTLFFGLLAELIVRGNRR